MQISLCWPYKPVTWSTLALGPQTNLQSRNIVHISSGLNREANLGIRAPTFPTQWILLSIYRYDVIALVHQQDAGRLDRPTMIMYVFFSRTAQV
jgi:hypothetical protein